MKKKNKNTSRCFHQLYLNKTGEKKMLCKESLLYLCYLISQLTKSNFVYSSVSFAKGPKYLASITKTLIQNIILNQKYIIEEFMLLQEFICYKYNYCKVTLNIPLYKLLQIKYNYIHKRNSGK